MDLFNTQVARKAISGRMDRASATETVAADSIPGPVQPKTRKTGIYSFFAWRSALKRNSAKPPPCVVDRW